MGLTEPLWIVGVDPEDGGWNVLRVVSDYQLQQNPSCSGGKIPSPAYGPNRSRVVLDTGIGILPRFSLLTDGGVAILLPLPTVRAAGEPASYGLPMTPSTRRRNSRGPV